MNENTSTNSDNVIQLPGIGQPQSYQEMLVEIIGTLSKQKAQGTKIDPLAALKLLEPQEENDCIREWMASNRVMTNVKFDRAMAALERHRYLQDQLGYVPHDVQDFVNKYVASTNTRLLPSGTLSRQRSFAVQDMAITQDNASTSPETQLIYDVANADGDDLNSLARELRLLNDQYALGYRDSSIQDAIDTWKDDTNRQTRVEAFRTIQFEKGRATGTVGQQMWQDMERANFDTTDTAPGFAIAVIRKFMWQVKRKARNMPVTNHLMPVLTGGIQGKGKSTFVFQMTKPLADLMRTATFQLLTDGKSMDIWSSPILFLDEMSYFSNADTEAVKNVITAPFQTMRLMKSNTTTPIRNASTLIGCSNKSLGQLVRDDTGLRRFAEIEFSTTPDWELSNTVDWVLLWQSVDENGDDPMELMGMMDMLKQQQEGNRNKSSTEVWVEQNGHLYSSWQNLSELHEAFRDWEIKAFNRSNTDQTAFGRRLTALSKSNPKLGVEKSRNAKGIVYKFRYDAAN